MEALVVGGAGRRNRMAAAADHRPLRLQATRHSVAHGLEHGRVTAGYDELGEIRAAEPLERRVGLPRRAFAHEQSGAGTIIDFSASGIGLEVEFSLSPGCRVKIQWPRGQVLGEVRYCREKPRGNYRAGVKITEVVELGEISEQSGAA